MLFNSFVFAGLFLPICLLAFWMTPSDSAKRWVLLFFSLIFYGYWHPPYLILLIGLVAVAWASALALTRYPNRWPVVAASVILLGTLAYYKYGAFLAHVLADIGARNPSPVERVALPLGISFIVFQALGYVIDVYRKQFAPERNFAVMLLFKAFFPQLIAGPICRAHELIPQIKGHFKFSLRNLTSGLLLFALGLALKMVIADNLAIAVDPLYSSSPLHPLSAAEAATAALGFGGQIFADFWGYSTMAVGLALMFGIEIPINFNLPYIATSLRSFWRRWHITLSQWLRDYLYISLGGSKHGRIRTTFALFTTMLLGGLWHGANYTFLVWGGIHGMALTLEHVVGISGKTTAAKPNIKAVAARSIGWVYTFAIVTIAWIYFRADTVPQANHIIARLFSGGWATTVVVKQALFFLAILAIAQAPVQKAINLARSGKVSPAISLVASGILVLIAIVLGAPQAVQFIYFEF